jgi:hypothetical protein
LDPSVRPCGRARGVAGVGVVYHHDAASDDNDDLPLQHQSNLQNNELLKIAILVATKTCTKETSHTIIDYGASCCVTPYIEDDYKLTLNDPDHIDDFLGIHFSHQDNGELQMSQT